MARNIGYVPRSKKSSIARITFSIDITGKPVQTVKLHKGIVAVGSVQGGNYIFSIPDDITATPNSSGIVTFENISIYEGTYLTKTFKLMILYQIKSILSQMRASIHQQSV